MLQMEKIILCLWLASVHTTESLTTDDYTLNIPYTDNIKQCKIYFDELHSCKDFG